eukprot:scaffold35231_cov52-Phaeocystis_antarctica.AAC.1
MSSVLTPPIVAARHPTVSVAMRRGRSPSPDDRPYKRERRSPPRRSPSGGRRSPVGRMERRSPPPETQRGGGTIYL